MRRFCVGVVLAVSLVTSVSAATRRPMVCTETGGEELGRSGYAYRGGCPPETERDFLSGYIVGRRVYSAEIYLKRARSEFEEAGKHSRVAIDFHSGKAIKALAKIDDPKSIATERSIVRKELKNHREQILLIEAEFDWTSDRVWDAHLHADDINSEIDGWRIGESHAFLLDQFAEAHSFSRSETAIEYCSDEPDTAFFVPGLYCLVRDGGILTDSTTEQVCATGPSRATLVRRGLWNGEIVSAAAFLHSFNVSRRAENGKRDEVGKFLTLFSGDGSYLGAYCPSLDE